jgi:steroid 5-alpha reductase family enzyme
MLRLVMVIRRVAARRQAALAQFDAEPVGAWACSTIAQAALAQSDATEKQALRSKGEAYAAYQRRVSRFVPRPPKPPARDA